MELYGQSERVLVEISCESPDYRNESTACFPVFDAVMNVFYSNTTEVALSSLKQSILKTNDAYGPNMLNSEMVTLNTYYTETSTGSRTRVISFIFRFKKK